MDGWIIADGDLGASQLLSAVRRQGIECPSAHVLDMDAIEANAECLRGFAGYVFVAARRLDARRLELTRKLRLATDPQAKLVVASSVLDDGSVLSAIRAGACDVLRADDSLDEEIANFISRVRCESRPREDRGRIVSIVPCHAPADANLLASSLCAALATPAAPCGLLDFHFRGADLALLLKLKPQHSILDLLKQGDIVDESMFRQAIATHESGIQLLAGPAAFSDLRNIRFQPCQQIIETAQRCWPIVIVNSEDIQHSEQVRALAVSHQIVLTMRLDIASLHRTQNHIEFLGRNHVSRDHLHVVAMGTGYAGELPPAEVKRFLKVQHLHCIPDDPVAAVMSVNVGNPLVLEAPASKASIAIRQFAESLLGRNSAAVPDPRRQPAAFLKAAAVACSVLPFYRGVTT